MKSVFTVIMLFLLGLNCTWAGESVGWIDSFDGKVADYKLIRGGKDVPVAIYTQLEKGDKLSVSPEGIQMLISLADGEAVTIKKKNSPYTVKSNAETPGIVSNMLSWAGNTLNVWHDEQGQVGSQMEMRSRDGDLFDKPALKTPLFGDESVLLLAGSRPLYIAWREGRGPYRVRLLDRTSGTTLFEVSEVDGERLKTGPVEFVSGRKYQIEIIDIGETITVPIEVKQGQDIPKAVDEISNATLHPLAMRMLYATWLAGIHEEWSFEAYQIVSDIEDEYAPGQLLRVALERGEKPE